MARGPLDLLGRAGRAATSGVAPMMWTVLAALAPGALAAAAAWSVAALAQVAAGVAACVLSDAAMSRLRGARGGSASDGSAAVTGAIVGLSVPPLAPLWVSVSASVFGVCVAKHCYGGLGANVFNPAMAGYAFAFLAFPAEFVAWPGAAAELGGWDALRAVATGSRVDAVASPTVMQAAGQVPGVREAAPALAFALGGVALLLLRVADWRLALSYLAGFSAVAAVAGDGLGVLGHLAAGGAVLAAFFVVTDPSSAPARPGNRLLFGALAGALTVAIRRWGSHPDGIAFAVLLANAAAPALDRVAEEIGARGRGR